MTINASHADDRAEPLRPQARVLAFPIYINRRLVVRLADQFLAIRPGPGRIEAFTKKHLAPLERKRRAVGIPPEVVEAEMWAIEDAVAGRLEELFPDEGES